MPSLNGRNAKKRCKEKKKYFTESEARAAAAVLLKTKGLRLRVYRCVGLRGQRKHWHLTSGRRKAVR